MRCLVSWRHVMFLIHLPFTWEESQGAIQPDYSEFGLA